MRFILLTVLALCLIQSIRCESFKEEFEEGSGEIVDEIPTDDDDGLFYEDEEEESGSGEGLDTNTDTEEPHTVVVPVPGGPGVDGFGLEPVVENPDETDLQENSPDDISPIGTASFLGSTHFIAALVVGGCVGLLFAICAIMLLAYRMRKKDEGSYALDEQKKPSAGYQYTMGHGSQEYYA